jgi:hypothetical protein
MKVQFLSIEKHIPGLADVLLHLTGQDHHLVYWFQRKRCGKKGPYQGTRPHQYGNKIHNDEQNKIERGFHMRFIMLPLCLGQMKKSKMDVGSIIPGQF